MGDSEKKTWYGGPYQEQAEGHRHPDGSIRRHSGKHFRPGFGGLEHGESEKHTVAPRIPPKQGLHVDPWPDNPFKNARERKGKGG